MEYLACSDQTPKSSLKLLVKLHGHADTVWAVHWRPNTDQLASCGGLCILLWGRTKETKRTDAFQKEMMSNNSWCLKAIIYNEKKHTRLLTSSSQKNILRIPTSLDPNDDLNIYINDLDSINYGAHTRTVRNLAWTRDGSTLAAASFDSTVTIWKEAKSYQDLTTNSDTNTNETVWKCISRIEGHEHEVKSVSWSPSAKQLVTCSRDKTIWIHSLVPPNAQSPEVTVTSQVEFSCAAILTGHTQDVKCVSWHPTKDFIISSSYDNTVRLWSKPSSKTIPLHNEEQKDSTPSKELFEEIEWECFQTLNDHTSTVWEVSFAPDGYSFASCSDDKTLRIWTCRSSISKNPSTLTSQKTPCASSPSTLINTKIEKEYQRSLMPYWFLVQPGFKPLTQVTLASKSTDTSDACSMDKQGPPSFGLNKKNNFEIPIQLENIWSMQWFCTQVLSGFNKRSVYSVAWHPVLDIIAIACGDNAIRLFRFDRDVTRTSEESSNHWVLDIEIEHAHKSDVNSVSWKNLPEDDGSWLLASCGDDRAVHIYSYRITSDM